MTWWIEPREIANKGQPTGRFRLTAESDEDGGGPFALCPCPDGHDSLDAARSCEDAQQNAKSYG